MLEPVSSLIIRAGYTSASWSAGFHRKFVMGSVELSVLDEEHAIASERTVSCRAFGWTTRMYRSRVTSKLRSIKAMRSSKELFAPPIPGSRGMESASSLLCLHRTGCKTTRIALPCA
jgi:hypothetical protein